LAGLYQVFVTYNEAQKLLPYFQYFSVEGPWRDLRTDAQAIVRELKDVRPIHTSDSPLGGKQIFLSERQFNLLNDVRAEADKPV